MSILPQAEILSSAFNSTVRCGKDVAWWCGRNLHQVTGDLWKKGRWLARWVLELAFPAYEGKALFQKRFVRLLCVGAAAYLLYWLIANAEQTREEPRDSRSTTR